MRIEITENGAGNTSIKANGVELSKYVTEFHLTQTAGEEPTLTLKMYVTDGMTVDLPEGAVIVKPINPK